MVIDDLLIKLMNKDYSALTLDELKIIKENDNIFELGSIFNAVKIDENSKDKVAKQVANSIPLRLRIIESLDKYPVLYDGKQVDYKALFFENLNRMSVIQTCYFIDTVCKLRAKKKLAFFGNFANDEIVYHEFNLVISKGNGLVFAFQIFGEGKYNNLRFLDVNLEYVDKSSFVEIFERNTRRYFYILNCVAEIILEFKDDAMPKKVSTAKRIKPFVSAIDDDKKYTTPKGKKLKDNWVYSDDGISEEPIDEGDNDE